MNPQSPSKRVALGELPANATTPRRSRTSHDFLKPKEAQVDIFRPGSPLKQVHSLEVSSPSKENRGKKRKAGDLDGNENNGDGRVVSPTMLGRNERSTEQGVSPATTTLEDADTTANADSDTTPTPEEAIISCSVSASQESSVTKVSASFSSLIDYNPRGSSPSDCADCNNPHTEDSVKMRAEALRLRLRMAMYKVKTNQTRLPLYALSLPDRPTPKSTPPEISPSGSSGRVDVSCSVSPVSPVRPTPTSSNSHSSARSKPFPQLSAAPILRPTAYSSCHISYNPIPSDVPSSPPSHSPEHAKTGYSSVVMETDAFVEKRIAEKQAFATPIAKRVTQILEDDTDDDGSDSARGGEELGWERLTSSVVKGKVAAGLLELRRGG